jgi:hypothetical protein
VRELLVAELTQERGREPVWPACVIPYGQQPTDWQDGLHMLQWCVERLRRRGFEIEVVTRHTPNGAVFMLTVPRREKP